ncbi:MAG TPA: alanine--tRNA ligase, partial [Actinomycetes bacterium]|nr:alanine--tRNA ligase [Actinomycetes bacterium]
ADSMYETDLFAPVLHEVQELSGAGYGNEDRVDRSLRIVAEHGRTASFLIADGVLPSNEGRGYILRRLLRRSVRHLRLLGVEDPALHRVGQQVVANLGEAWPELVAQRSLIEQVVASEEDSFSRTLRQGSTLLEGAIRRTREQGTATLAGDTAFQLHDTYGFPYELTLEAAGEAGLDVDADRFRQLMDDQRRRAKEARRELDADLRRLDSYRDLSSRHGRTSFVGYETTTAEGRILGLLADGEELAAAGEGDQVELILDRTPFYAEGGGQVGDSGLVRTGSGAVLQVSDTRPGLEGFSIHTARVVSGEPRVGDQVHAEVDADRRGAVARSHTATHTLHWALRDQLGEHARQQGSLVDAGRLRFDFAHFQSVPAERLAEIEAAVNRQLLADPDVKVWQGSLAEAEAAGAISLFGEKYGSVVRVVEVGDFSRELCGGTHVGHGSQVGPVHVLGEASIGANLRRIEALTGLEALRYVDRERQLLAEVATLLKTRPEDAPEQLRRRLEALAAAQRELERLRVAGLERLAGELAGRVAGEAGGWLVVERVPEAGGDDLRRIASAVRDRVGAGSGVVVLGSEAQGKAAMVALLTTDLAGDGAAARDVLVTAAKAVGGGAGGKGDLASAGGRDPGQLDEALRIARADAVELLQGAAAG